MAQAIPVLGAVKGLFGGGKGGQGAPAATAPTPQIQPSFGSGQIGQSPLAQQSAMQTMLQAMKPQPASVQKQLQQGMYLGD